jgi:hypothetical protein
MLWDIHSHHRITCTFVLFLEPLHGVTYACSKTSTVDFAAQVSQIGYESSAQGVITMILGLGGVLGLAAGGWIEHLF